MSYLKKYPNGVRLIVNKIDGLQSVTTGILVGVGSVNEDDYNNGISHFIEHVTFKGTKKRNAFQVSDDSERIGAQINAFTAKEMTCYYIKSTTEHFNESFEILSDVFLNCTFPEDEIEKEKGVVIEEINMTEDAPDDICSDLMAQSFCGNVGLGRTILGTAENVKSFTADRIKEYVNKNYVGENIVISVAGNIDVETAVKTVEDLFIAHFTNNGKKPDSKPCDTLLHNSLVKVKDIEQAHIGLVMPSLVYADKDSMPLSVANVIIGGGMSSRLFQTIREKLGLAYTVYSYISQYKTCGFTEVYAGVNPKMRDTALDAVYQEIKNVIDGGVTEAEVLRGKEQMKSSFTFSLESTATQMLLYGKHLLVKDEVFDFNTRLNEINAVNKASVDEIIKRCFDLNKVSLATVGRDKEPLKFPTT